MASKYRDLKFKSKEEFEEWLAKTTKYKVEFEDDGQDFTEWWIDPDGEVLHSKLQSSVWNGCMIDINSLVEGGVVMLQAGGNMKPKIKRVEVIK